MREPGSVDVQAKNIRRWSHVLNRIISGGISTIFKVKATICIPRWLCWTPAKCDRADLGRLTNDTTRIAASRVTK